MLEFKIKKILFGILLVYYVVFSVLSQIEEETEAIAAEEEDLVDLDDSIQQELNLEELLKMDQKEKDKILSCIEIISQKMKLDSRVIQGTIQMLSSTLESDVVSQKITGDMLNKCYYSIDEPSILQIFKDGVHMEPDYNEELLSFADIDYSTYKLLNPNEFNLTPDTQILFMKLEHARTEYITSNKEKIEKNKNSFYLFGYSIKDIPLKTNIFILLVLLALFFGGIIIFLKKIIHEQNNSKAFKRNESKEKNKLKRK